jgi:hypothetical protein
MFWLRPTGQLTPMARSSRLVDTWALYCWMEKYEEKKNIQRVFWGTKLGVKLQGAVSSSSCSCSSLLCIMHGSTGADVKLSP